MIRLYLFAEGQTEQTFASNLMTPHLANYGAIRIIIWHCLSR